MNLKDNKNLLFLLLKKITQNLSSRSISKLTQISSLDFSIYITAYYPNPISNHVCLDNS